VARSLTPGGIPLTLKEMEDELSTIEMAKIRYKNALKLEKSPLPPAPVYEDGVEYEWNFSDDGDDIVKSAKKVTKKALKVLKPMPIKEGEDVRGVKVPTPLPDIDGAIDEANRVEDDEFPGLPTDDDLEALNAPKPVGGWLLSKFVNGFRSFSDAFIGVKNIFGLIGFNLRRRLLIKAKREPSRGVKLIALTTGNWFERVFLATPYSWYLQLF